MSKEFSRQEVAKHNKKGDVWIIVDTKVYDVSKFADLHPGGANLFYDNDVAGQECSEVFYGLHRHSVIEKYKRLQIGVIGGEKPKYLPPQIGQLSQVPYAEPMWLTRGYFSPYFEDSHRKLQQFMRKFTDEVIAPEARAAEETNERPTLDLIIRNGDEKVNHMRLGPGKHLHGLTLPGGLRGEDYTYMHEMVVTQELARIGARGYADGFGGGMTIGLPPVMNFGRTQELKDRVIGEVLSGKKYISLAITEPYAGSDVAGIRTTATKTEDGKHWIVNGIKVWITGGHFSDYFSVACRTGKNQLTMILVERTDDVDTKIVKTSYSSSAGTARIIFDNVKVPVENTLGKEGDGLRVVLSNFNHERWVMACASARSQRLFVEQAFIWAHVRKAFGKSLISQPVIRQKFAEMFARLQAGQAFLEQVTFQMTKMDYKTQSDLLAGEIGLLKGYLTRNAEFCADNCVNILGGRGLTRTGMGSMIEGFRRTVKFDEILGGASEVLYDLGAKRASAKMPKATL